MRALRFYIPYGINVNLLPMQILQRENGTSFLVHSVRCLIWLILERA